MEIKRLLFLACVFIFSPFQPTNAVGNIRDVFLRKYEYGKEYTISINNSVEYIFDYNYLSKFDNSEYPARISVSSSQATIQYPIFITARQQRGVLSWQIPVVVEDKKINSLSRTLCPNNNYYINNIDQVLDTQNHPIIHIYTSSVINISVTLKIDKVEDFYITSNKKKEIKLSPSTPSIFFYSFDSEDAAIERNDVESGYEYISDKPQTSAYAMRQTQAIKPIKDLKHVIVRIDSEDDLCMLVSIQNATCPVFDTENDIMFEGYYETVSKRGGITITQQRFPKGFFIVLLVKTSDEVCSGVKPNSTVSQFSNFFDVEVQQFDLPNAPWSNKQNVPDRLKTVSLQIYPTITRGDYWLAVMMAILCIFLVYIIFLISLFCYKSKPMNLTEVDCPDSISFLQESICNSPVSVNADNSGINPSISNQSPLRNNIERRNSDISMSYADDNGKIYLNQLCTKDAKTLKNQSNLYMWHLLTVAVFYGLPVIQLVIAYQRVLNQSGNQDLCYYNFLCAHPLGYLSDFNHVFSNLGYVLLGALFLFIVWRRHKMHQDPKFDQFFGIPQHFGIYYAMGFALIMEGVLSASYHVCPNHMNFQFDTSFMYIMAVLSMVKIYQTRHPDINARAHSTFGVLAAAILICLIGVMYPNFYFWLFFTILHISVCLFLTFQIYYFGHWKFSLKYCLRCKKCQPIYGSRFILVLLANMCNFLLAGYGLYFHRKDFATHLLYLFLMNLALHLLFYMVMKVSRGERPTAYVWILLVMAMITWAAALYFFFSQSTSWALTPAQSRTYNRPCYSILKFYDSHDVWHILSALSMFLSFMLLLTLDDDISHTIRQQISVF